MYNNKKNSNSRRPKNNQNSKSGNYRKYRGNRSYKKKSSDEFEDPISRKYLFLVETQINARKKYHEMYFRADRGPINKLRNHYISSTKQLLEYEEKLTPEEKEFLDKFKVVYKEDTTYSTAHNEIPLENQDNLPARFTDPHVLQSQKDSSFKDDTLESSGTILDYKKLKNL